MIFPVAGWRDDVEVVATVCGFDELIGQPPDMVDHSKLMMRHLMMCGGQAKEGLDDFLGQYECRWRELRNDQNPPPQQVSFGGLVAEL